MMYQNTKWKQQMFYLCVVYAIWQIGLQWMNMLWPFLQWDADPPMEMIHIGIIHGFGSLFNMLGAFVMGQIIDNYGIRSSFVISIVLTSIYYAFIRAKSFWAFMFCQMLRIGFQFDHSTEMYIATTTTDTDRTNAMLKLGLPIGASLLISPIIAGKLSIYFDLRTAQLIDGVFLLSIALPIVICLLAETHDVPSKVSSKLNVASYGHLYKNQMLQKCILLRVALILPMTVYDMVTRQFTFRQYVETPSDASYIYLAMGASAILTNFVLMKKLQQIYYPKQLIQISLTILALIFLALTFVSSYFQLMVVMVLQMASYSIAFAEICAQLTSCVDKNDMGKATGMAISTQWMVQCIVPIAAAYFMQYYDWQVLCYMNIVILIGTIYGVSVYGQFINRRMVQLPLFQ